MMYKQSIEILLDCIIELKNRIDLKVSNFLFIQGLSCGPRKKLRIYNTYYNVTSNIGAKIDLGNVIWMESEENFVTNLRQRSSTEAKWIRAERRALSFNAKRPNYDKVAKRTTVSRTFFRKSSLVSLIIADFFSFVIRYGS